MNCISKEVNKFLNEFHFTRKDIDINDKAIEGVKNITKEKTMSMKKKTPGNKNLYMDDTHKN